jgi:hypothetical protein
MIAPAEQAWDELQPELRAAVGATYHDVWISVLLRFSPADHQLYLVAPNALYRDWVRDNYADDIDRLLRARDPDPARGRGLVLAAGSAGAGPAGGSTTCATGGASSAPSWPANIGTIKSTTNRLSQKARNGSCLVAAGMQTID